jgi:hypothetical protein
MLQDPAGVCLPAFARQRVRMIDVVNELVEAREPVRVVRKTFAALTFDAEGHIAPQLVASFSGSSNLSVNWLRVS